MHKLVTTQEEWEDVLRFCRGQDAVAVDLETTGLEPWYGDQIIGVSVGVPGRAWYVPVRHTPVDSKWQGKNVPEAVEMMRAFLQGSTRKVFHNASFDMKFLAWELGEIPRNCDCTMIRAWCDDDRRGNKFSKRNLSLDGVASELLGWGKARPRKTSRLGAWATTACRSCSLSTSTSTTRTTGSSRRGSARRLVGGRSL